MDESAERKRKRLRRLLAALLGLGLGALVFAVFLDGSGRPAQDQIQRVITVLPPDLRETGESLFGQADSEPAGLAASGIIQAKQVAIASEFGGRIDAIPVLEGDRVVSGDLVVQLDTTLIDAQVQAAEALLQVAEAGLAQALAGARPGQLTVAQAQLALAETGQTAARQAVSDTMALVQNPQDIWLQIAVAQVQAQAAQHEVARAVALKDAAEVAKGAFEEIQSQVGSDGRYRVPVADGSIDDLPIDLPPDLLDLLPGLGDGDYIYGDWELHIRGGSYTLFKLVGLPFELHLTPNQWWQSWVGVNAAMAQEQGIQTSLYHLYRQADQPQMLEAQVDQALSFLAQSEAHVASAQAQLDGLKAGATPEAIAALEARVAQAQTALLALQRQAELLAIRAPLSGTVVSLAAHPGEVAAKGATLLTIADLEALELVVYVPENQIGRLGLGQLVEIAVDSFPDQVFVGQVVSLSSQAEFTPRNVATQEERLNLVFAVQIGINNQGGLLKPGMPADARLIEQEGN